MVVGKEIALEAKKKGICKEWFQDMLKKNDIKPLCDMYFVGDDWAMENDFPDVNLIRRFKGNSNKYGLHADFIGVLENPINCALFGSSDAELLYEGFFAGKLIVRHESKAKITTKGDAFLLVNALDYANVTINALENSRVKVYNYSEKSNIIFLGNVEVVESKF